MKTVSIVCKYLIVKFKAAKYIIANNNMILLFDFFVLKLHIIFIKLTIINFNKILYINFGLFYGLYFIS